MEISLISTEHVIQSNDVVNTKFIKPSANSLKGLNSSNTPAASYVVRDELKHDQSQEALARAGNGVYQEAAENIIVPNSSGVEELSPEEAGGPFEGPEKLLEIWWSDMAEHVHGNGKGLRAIQREDWESMLDEVHCKVLSTIPGNGVDAYLLSESSMFVWPHKLILKTCGTTTLLLGLPTILRLAKEAGFTKGIWRVFYSRKTFMFPELQKGPHRDWKDEMEVLDHLFKYGAGYTVGPMNGDHWLLYMTEADDTVLEDSPDAHLEQPPTFSSSFGSLVNRFLPDHQLSHPSPPDQTLEILMSDLHPSACASFYFPNAYSAEGLTGHTAGKILSDKLGITNLFPASTPGNKTHMDAFFFQPCGYSANIVMQKNRYATIHVTPEADWSYASFETNMEFGTAGDGSRMDVQEVVSKLLGIFNPGRWTLTLFVSTNVDEGQERVETNGDQGLAALHRGAFGKEYKRTAKIVYDFGPDYELLFSTFRKR